MSLFASRIVQLFSKKRFFFCCNKNFVFINLWKRFYLLYGTALIDYCFCEKELNRIAHDIIFIPIFIAYFAHTHKFYVISSKLNTISHSKKKWRFGIFRIPVLELLYGLFKFDLKSPLPELPCKEWDYLDSLPQEDLILRRRFYQRFQLSKNFWKKTILKGPNFKERILGVLENVWKKSTYNT